MEAFFLLASSDTNAVITENRRVIRFAIVDVDKAEPELIGRVVQGTSWRCRG